MPIEQRPEGGNLPQVCFNPGERSEQERVERDGKERTCQQQCILLLIEHTQRDTSRAKNEGEFPDLSCGKSETELRIFCRDLFPLILNSISATPQI